MTEPEMIAAWAGPVGQTWVKLNALLDRQLEPIGLATLAKAQPAPGKAVLDVGCGAGATSRELAARVGEDGWVLGVDVSPPLLDLARSRVGAARNLAFLEADAGAHPFEDGAFDLLFSRFGVMFFADPVAAFENLRKAVRLGGRLAFCCWRKPEDNLWLSLPLKAATELFPDRPPVDLQAPGPFAFCDPDRVRRILADAGWSDVSVEPLDLDIGGGSLDEAVNMLLRVGVLGGALREAGATAELMGKADALVRRAIEPYATTEGVMVPSASWIVTAQRA